MPPLSSLRHALSGLFGGRPTAPPAPADAPPPGQLAQVDAVLDAVAEPVLLVDRGRVVVANRAALALLGRHIVGQDARLAIRHPDAAALLARDATPATGEPVLLDGLGALDQLWAMRVGAAEGGLRVVHLSDRSAGRAADRMRTDFVANASHELRTPLASIIGYAETLQGEAGEEAPLRARFLGIVLDEARRMQRLVQDLLSLSRIEADRFRLPGQRLDLAALVDQVAGEVRAAEAGVELHVEVARPLPAVIGDAPQLLQLLHNLVGNARAYGRSGAPVTITARADAGGTRLAVADRGEGIAAEHLPRLTERFYRVDASRGRAAAGTGLGLAIVKHIVERHRGRLEIGSTLGVGTTVTVWLPAAEPAVTEP
jgi:two-component system phosphate regulon sensor histidine kinase PhoR